MTAVSRVSSDQLTDASKGLLQMTMPAAMLKYCFSTSGKATRFCSVV